MADYRIEHDSMGEVRVPREAKWRATTQRAVENFPISGQGLDTFFHVWLDVPQKPTSW